MPASSRFRGQAYTEFLITFTVFMIFTWSIFGLAKIMDLEYSSQQARRYLGWQTEVIGNQAGSGETAPDARKIESLFFEHPLYGFGSNAAPKSNITWEDPTPGDQSTLPATLEFSANAITLNNNTRALANSGLVVGADHPVFAGNQFSNPVIYQNPTVAVNLAQVPYLMPDAITETNPRLLDQSGTVRVNVEATGGVVTETLLPTDEADLVNQIGPTPSALQMAATELWVGTVAVVQNFFGQTGLAAYPFEELTVTPLDDFFITTAPEQSNVLPANRITP